MRYVIAAFLMAFLLSLEPGPSVTTEDYYIERSTNEDINKGWEGWI